jgi:hypothetical protein
VQQLLTTLAAELERPRRITAQVAKHLSGTYGVGRDGIAAFLVHELPGLEEYEVDLTFSPLFTPTLSDQAVFAELLGPVAVPRSQWPELIRQLVARPIRASLVTESDESLTVPLREVVVERYVNRLRLDGAIPEPLFRLIANLAPAADRPLLKAVARRAIWENEPRRQILMRYLTLACGGEGYRQEDAVGLLKLAETYAPADLADLLRRVPHWHGVLRHEITSAANPKPFFNERVQEMHGGGRDQRRADDARIVAKQQELAFLERLEKLLAA